MRIGSGSSAAGQGRFGRVVRRATVAIGGVVMVVAATAIPAGAAPSVGSRPAAVPAPVPSADPFYQAPPGLASARPGQVLRTRPVRFVAQGVTTPIVATQAAYRSTGEQGQPILGVTTVLRPLAGPTTRIVSFHMAYDGLGSQCDPSYTLQGFAPSKTAQIEQTVIAGYLASGHTVLVPDYEGTRSEWTIGRQSGTLALDGIRAGEKVLRAPTSTPVGLIGYSGGSVPTNSAAELAPSYAPELAIVGAAGGGLPVNLAHNLPYVSGSKDWAGVMPAIVVAYQRAYGIAPASTLSPRGAGIVNTVQSQCIAAFASKYPGLTNGALVRSPYRGLLDVPGVSSAIARNVMGTFGTPRIPMLLGVGQKDAVGDGVMVAADVADLAKRYCARGVRAQFNRYVGDSHGDAFIPFQRDAAVFLAASFAGRSTATCAS
ncbi:lipase family protein [Gordonia soli]|uniref:Putative lipase n=1 Tax=Gordonia soli NBRC 108243 TaxID=1223545 RepID=M0QRF7_9ACTN|nr:lipase family protein [Gordonia soli]GAC70896.1 putative lipase [Gordonia soli NBRC 108243]